MEDIFFKQIKNFLKDAIENPSINTIVAISEWMHNLAYNDKFLLKCFLLYGEPRKICIEALLKYSLRKFEVIEYSILHEDYLDNEKIRSIIEILNTIIALEWLLSIIVVLILGKILFEFGKFDR